MQSAETWQLFNRGPCLPPLTLFTLQGPFIPSCISTKAMKEQLSMPPNQPRQQQRMHRCMLLKRLMGAVRALHKRLL